MRGCNSGLAPRAGSARLSAMAGIEQTATATARLLRTALLALVLGSCSSTPDGPPQRPQDVCAIFAERPDWRSATEASALRWGAPVELQMAIIWRESGFRADVRPPERYALGIIPTGPASSAFGYPQAIDGTWDWYRRETGNRGADRDDFADAADFVGWYVAKSRATTGLQPFDAFGHYIAYHEGHAGYRRGGWRAKSWLIDTARQVAAQAARYRGQLSRC